jgi:integrase
MKRTSDGKFLVQIRVGDGCRPSFAVVAPDEPTFRARLVTMTEIARLLVKQGRLVEAKPSLLMLAAAGDDFDGTADGIRRVCAEPVAAEKPKGYAGMTFLEFGEEWTSGRLFKRFRGMHKIRAKKPKSVEDDQRRIEFVAGVVGPVLMRDFSLEHFEAVMAAIPEGGDSDSSRRALAQVMSWLLRRAVNLRVRTDFPLSPGSLPTVTQHREFQLLYPREDAQLMACPDVDLFDRAFYGFSVRNGCRKQNLLDLRWQDIDVVDGQVWVPDTKTGKPVAFDLEPGCVRALRALKTIADAAYALAEDEPGASVPRSACIFPQWHPDTIAKRFRKHLLSALGEDHRAQLFEKTTHQRLIEYHDLRASFITFALANGRSEEWIRERSGHTTSQMISRYRRPRVAKLAMRDWLPLDVALGLDVVALEAPVQASLPAAAALPPAALPPAATRPQLEDGGDRSRHLLPLGDESAELGGQVELAGLGGEVAQAAQVAGAELALHGAHPTPPATPNRVATGVATGVFDDSAENEETSMNQDLSDGTPAPIRTGDQRIRNQGVTALTSRDHDVPTARSTRTDANVHSNPHEVGKPLPVSALTEADLALIAGWAVAAGACDVLSRVTTDWAIKKAANATQSNVTSLLVERRKRDAK